MDVEQEILVVLLNLAQEQISGANTQSSNVEDKQENPPALGRQ